VSARGAAAATRESARRALARFGRRQTERLGRGPAGRFVREAVWRHPYVWGTDPDRVRVAPTAVLNNALLNCAAGTITVADQVFLGHGVCLLTGTHDHRLLGAERLRDIPRSGRDIHVEEGAWLASNVTVVGPCRIGRHAVVAAGAVVIADVEAYAIVGGVPACRIGSVRRATETG